MHWAFLRSFVCPTLKMLFISFTSYSLFSWNVVKAMCKFERSAIIGTLICDQFVTLKQANSASRSDANWPSPDHFYCVGHFVIIIKSGAQVPKRALANYSLFFWTLLLLSSVVIVTLWLCQTALLYSLSYPVPCQCPFISHMTLS